MVTQVHDTTCRNCGAAADVGQTKCRFCKQPVMISTFNSVYSMPVPMVNQYAATYREALQNEPDAKDLNNGIAMCYLKLESTPKSPFRIIFSKADICKPSPVKDFRNLILDVLW
jgi:hypothetical protein